MAPMAWLWLLFLLALARPVSGTCRGTCGLRPMAKDRGSAAHDYSPSASADGTSRIVGGTKVQHGAWPGIVSIQATWKNGTWHMCSGVLLSLQWVLTVAHCFARAGDIHKGELSEVYRWDVVIGATDLTKPGPNAVVRHIQRLLMHQDYVPATARNDIALVELNQPVACSEYIQLGCVPNPSLKVSELKSCYIAGWSFAMAGDVMLQESKVHLMDTELCNSSSWYGGAIYPENLCAGYPQGGIDTCQGDSGGPLICKDRKADSFWLVGMSSWGKGCDTARHPGIYTSTQHFYNWILLQTGLTPAETAPEPAATSSPKQHHRPEPESHMGLSLPDTVSHSRKPAPTSSGTLMPTTVPLLILVQFLNLLQEFLHFLKDKKT